MTRTLRLTALLLALALAGSVRAQQPSPAGAGFISGQVVEGGTTRPVPGAVVSVSSAVTGGPRVPNTQVIADAQGRFVFSGVPAGEFRLQASHPGWQSGAYGLDGPIEPFGFGIIPVGEGGQTLKLSDGARARVTVPVWRDALISGQVTDASGEPIVGAWVTAMRWTLVGSRRRLGSASGVYADDRGSFTLSVPPGEYLIGAASEQVRLRTARGEGIARPHVFRQTFYPQSAGTSGAAVVAVRSGDDRSGFVLAMPLEPAVQVRGVLNPLDAGRMPTRIFLRAEGDVVRDYFAGPVDAQGRFAFENVPAGRYVLQTNITVAVTDPSQPAELWARSTVDVGNSDVDISVDLHRKLLVHGRVEFAGGTQTPADLGLSARVYLTPDDELPSDALSAGVAVGADGRFTAAITPGRYVASAGVIIVTDRNAPPAAIRQAANRWSLRSALQVGRDVADGPVVVNSDLANVVLTFTDQPTFVRGRVTDRDGRLDSAVLLVFPDDDALRVDYGYGRRVRVIRPQRDGAFEFTNLPEGHYLISAVRTSASDRAVRNPAFLASLESRARRVTVREGATVVQDVEVVTMPRPDAALAPLTVPFPPAERASVLQTPTTALTGGASIAGTVLDVTSKRPLSGVRVALTPALAGVPSPGGAYTDDQGRFLLPVPPGQHTLYASKPQFASTVYGATHPSEPGTPITIGANQRIADVVIQMMKGAAIGGSVLDQNGQPLRGAQVNVRAYRWTARGREMIANRAPGIIGAPTTDARGAFRAYGLPPGEYVVQITPQQGLSTVMPLTTQADVAAASGPVAGAKPTAEPRSGVRYAPMFYPNTIDLARAEAVKLSAGDERFVNFQFSLIPTATISGIVRGPDNNAPERAGVSLALIDPVTPASPVQRIIGGIDATGAFTVRGVAPGRYLLSSTRTTMTPNLFASVEVVVDGDQSGITLDLLPAGTVSGRIGGGAASAGRQQGVRISLSPLANTVGPPNSQLSAAIDTENRFSFSSVPPGRYRLELTGPNTVAKPRVVSQRVGGVETVEAGLEIKGGEQLQVDVELMPSEAQVAGRTRDRAGQPATRPYVVLFAKEPQAWTPPSRRIFGVRPDQNGRYLFPDVPAGDYLVTTVASVEAGEWFNPSVLTKLAPAASPVSVRRGDKLEIDLETR